MKCHVTIIILIFLIGCGIDKQPLTNDEIIFEVKKCHDAGMGYNVFKTFPGAMIFKIECCGGPK